MERKTIDSFRGEYGFLSNFYKTDILFEGINYPTLENAFQAAKTSSQNEKIHISKIGPAEAKKYGRNVLLRRDWDSVKTKIMHELVMIKFAEPMLQSKLLATEDAVLIEGNNWYDVYWGVCKGKGSNMLGKILMITRGFYRSK